MRVIQENKDILGDGYEGDVLGESTPDVIVSEFVSFFFSNFEGNVYSDLFTNSLIIIVVKISLISYFLFLLFLFFICILCLVHIFFIINTAPMCIFYIREINLKPYFLYIQQ